MTTSSASTFIAIYRGRTPSDARLIAVSADPVLVASVVAQLLERQETASTDPAVAPIDRGRRRGLRVIADELTQTRPDGTGEWR